MATKQHNVRLPDDLSAGIEQAVAEVETRLAATLNRQVGHSSIS